MRTLIINVVKKKDLKLIKELLDRLEIEVTENKTTLRKQLPKSGFKTQKDFLKFAGSTHGELVSKEHIRSLAWKRRS
ncbi:MAG: hypothetical protein ACOYXA_17605 [Bacteroidota bacterium]